MSRKQLEEHRSIWKRKGVLADVYRVWFEALLKRVPSGARVLEVGAGPGLLASYARSRRPDVHWIASDLIETPWNDVVADGLRLPLRTGSLDALVALDLMHHLARPAAFFSEAARVLRPGGQISAIEPWVTALSYPIYRWIHQEGCSLGLDPWNPFGVEGSVQKEPLQGDNACAWRLVGATPGSRWEDLGFHPPGLILFNGFAYLCSLGFRRTSLLPRPLAPLLIHLDEITSPLAGYLGLRALLQWDRRP